MSNNGIQVYPYIRKTKGEEVYHIVILKTEFGINNNIYLKKFP